MKQTALLSQKSGLPQMFSVQNSTRTFLLISFFLLSFVGLRAQTSITYTITQQPCNAGGVADGVVQFTINGVPNPITVQYYDYVTMTYVTSTISSGNTFTLNNWGGSDVYLSAFSGSIWANSPLVSSPPFTYSISTTPAICPALGSATATITGGASPYTVQWMDIGMTNVIATGNPAALPGGFYSVNITDNNGCTFGSALNYDSVYVQNISGITGSAGSTAANCTNGTATISGVSGGLAPYSYQWSNGASSSSINGLMMGSYSCTVTDAQGCFQDFYIYVSQGVYINVPTTPTPATCLQSDGSAIAFATGGTAPYSFTWSTGQNTQSVSNLSAGGYQVIVTDANSCVGTGYAYINASTPITATYASSPSSCTSATGSSTLTISGGQAPYTISWSTFPVQSGVTLSNVASGYYAFQITDANGCVRTGSAYVPPVSTIYASVYTNSTPCAQSLGVATISASGTAMPLTYLWNNSSTATSISGLAAGNYYCTVTDANGCDVTKYGIVNSTSPVNIGFSTTPASCIFTSDGSITAIASGGTAPYTYSWGSATLSNISQGGYYAYVTDANGCSSGGYAHVGYNATNTSCYCTISGYAYEDLNGNCTQDVGENGINHVMIGCSGQGYTYTDANGYYSFIVPSGTYTVTENPQGLINLAPCQNNNQVVTAVASSGCTIPVHFGNTITPVHDVSIHTFSWTQPVPGNVYQQGTVIQNEGTFTENGIQLGFAHDGQLSFQNPTPLTYTQQNMATFPNWYSVTSGFPTLAAGASLMNTNVYNTPTNIPIGTSLVMRDTVAYMAPMSNWLNENTPWNNVEYYTPIVIGPYDPNFKEVSPRGIGAQGYIPFSDTLLDYTIHFQNLGTAPAQNVVVTDTLDTDLDWMTVRPGWSSHNYVATLDNNGVLIFRFNNIYLPDSATSPLGSIGIVMYTVESKPGLANLTQITNSANIYFDYNAPVITNTTVNTYDMALGIKNTQVSDESLNVFPNPAGENVMLSFDADNNEATSVMLFDISGKQMLSQKFATSNGKNFINLDLRSVANGMYFVKVQNGEREMVKKLSVAR